MQHIHFDVPQKTRGGNYLLLPHTGYATGYSKCSLSPVCPPYLFYCSEYASLLYRVNKLKMMMMKTHFKWMHCGTDVNESRSR